ncbi:hypothetical protein SDC9_189931 [bioreactor metagenome]|uniref:Carbohydrate kinase PfkB domain-containing protein n=1 Tax=bioreactor metagenome TaxID=1076179 RepID=A0A645I1P0_9ZZZZ
MFRRTNLIFTNESEWEIMKKFGDDFSEKEMIIKRGEKGAIYKYKNQVLTVPAPRVEAVDFSGAGDVLAGSFLVLRAKKVPIEKALKKAVDTASYSITDFGVEHLRIDSIEECL